MFDLNSMHSLDAKVRQIFDRLRVTPQHYLDYESGRVRAPITPAWLTLLR
jgi:hypothetical protein